MPRPRLVVAAILLPAVALGLWSAAAIRRTADRRAALVDALVMRMPPVPGARELAAWKPVADADLAHLTLCFDDSDPTRAVARLVAALVGTPWRTDAIASRRAPERASVTARDGAYRMHVLAEPGSRTTCDAAKHQVLMSLEAAPIAASPR